MHKTTVMMIVGSSALAGSILTYLMMTMRPAYVMSSARRWSGAAVSAVRWPFARRRHFSEQKAAPYRPVNTAFEDYRALTLARLESEARDFHDYLERLRFTRDREAFEDFLRNRPSRLSMPNDERAQSGAP